MSRRRNTRWAATTFRNYRTDTDSDSDWDNEDVRLDVRLALVNLMQAAISQSSRKSPNRKRLNRTKKSDPAATKKQTRKRKKQVTVNNYEAVCLDSDTNFNESIPTATISDTQKDAYLKNVQKRVDSFFKSKRLMSDDDDDDDPSAQKNSITKPTAESKSFYAISDSDEELPSTSAANNLKEHVEVTDSTNDKEEDLMEIVDKILDCDDTPVEINTSNVESDNWNDFKSKAEEIMGSVTALLDTFKDEKDKEKAPPEESPTKPKPSCPICLEVLDGNIVPGSTICGHIFCMDCIKQVVKTSKSCPTCRKRITIKQIHPLYL